MSPPDEERLTYADAGVDIAAGEKAVELDQGARALDVPARGGRRRRRLRRAVRGRLEALPRPAARVVDRRRRHEVGRSPGSPNRRDTIGIDCVAMSVDDIAAQGAEPLFFLDYISIGKLVPDEIDELVAGVADGCRAGAVRAARRRDVGASRGDGAGRVRPRRLRGRRGRAGARAAARRARRRPHRRHREPGPALQRLLARPRRAARPRADATSTSPAWPGAHHSLADELLAPSVIYAPAMLKLADEVDGARVRARHRRRHPRQPRARAPRPLRRGRDARRVGRAADLRRDPARPATSPTTRWSTCSTSGSACSRSCRPTPRCAPSTSCARPGHDAWLVGEVVDGHGHARVETR